ncbi:MAG: tetratricopeptide repeat protein, partial [Cyclobacteriaceae bacterium]|nr:tetratricopeptide repeat protein [Cyclobacteriaceae bacterium]
MGLIKVICKYLYAFALVSIAAAGQGQLPDSLARFNNRKHDSLYIIELNKLATDYLKINPHASRKIALHTAEVAQAINFKRGYARALNVIGNSFWYEGVYDLAQNYYLLAARQYQTIGDSIGLGQTYNNLGEVHKRMGEHTKALDFLFKAIKLKRRDSATYAITWYNIGELYNQSGKFAEAKKYFNQALTQALKDNNQRVTG